MPLRTAPKLTASSPARAACPAGDSWLGLLANIEGSVTKIGNRVHGRRLRPTAWQGKSLWFSVDEALYSSAAALDGRRRVGEVQLNNNDVGGTPLAAPPSAALFESYDDDLEWIIERLVERTGGRFGVVCRFLLDETAGLVLAPSKSIPIQDESFNARLVLAVRRARPSTGPKVANNPIIEWRWSSHESGFESYRALSLSFWPSETVNLVAAVFRPDRAIDLNVIHRAAATVLYPVLSRYVHLWWLHRQERNRANAYQTALDIADVGIMLLDRRLQVLFTNARANVILSNSDGLVRHGPYLTAVQAEAGLRFQSALQHALHFNWARGSRDQVQRSPLLAIGRGKSLRALIVSVVGLERPAIDVLDPAVIVYAIDPSRDLRDLLAPLCNIYNLTNAESRLAYYLVSGMRLSAAAAHMKIRDATARSYLKQVFAKTATNRQSDLVRLMLTSLQRLNTSVELQLV